MGGSYKSASSAKDLVPIWSSTPIKLQEWIGTYKSGPSVKRLFDMLKKNLSPFNAYFPLGTLGNDQHLTFGKN
jgi:hypothetical protein